jgi:hypothetical protein
VFWGSDVTVLQFTLMMWDLTFLGEFTKLRKAIISFVMSACSACLSFCTSICKEQLGSHWTDFREI